MARRPALQPASALLAQRRRSRRPPCQVRTHSTFGASVGRCRQEETSNDRSADPETAAPGGCRHGRQIPGDPGRQHQRLHGADDGGRAAAAADARVRPAGRSGPDREDASRRQPDDPQGDRHGAARRRDRGGWRRRPDQRADRRTHGQPGHAARRRRLRHQRRDPRPGLHPFRRDAGVRGGRDAPGPVQGRPGRNQCADRDRRHGDPARRSDPRRRGRCPVRAV